MSLNIDELMKSVTNVLVNVPKKTLKSNFARHCSNGEDEKLMKQIPKLWKSFSAAYTDFQKTFPERLAGDEFLQRTVTQLAVVSALMGKISPENDGMGLYAGLAVYVSEWSSYLGSVLFPDQPKFAFFALWSSMLNVFKVEWAFHGNTYTVLISLLDYISEDDDEPFSICFPGPAPHNEEGAVSWAKKAFKGKTLEVFNAVFGTINQKRLFSKQVFYYNPADEDFSLLRDFNNTWAFDLIPSSPEVQEFEEDEEEEEENATYKEEVTRLKGILKATAMDAPEQVVEEETKTPKNSE